MSFQNAFGIYQVLKDLLVKADRPLTCVELYDDPNVKRFAADANRVSDYLGHLYRRGILSRVPSTGIGAARWAYSWKDKRREAPPQRHTQPRLVIDEEEQRQAFAKAAGVLVSRPRITVTEERGIIKIDLDQVTITITPK